MENKKAMRNLMKERLSHLTLPIYEEKSYEISKNLFMDEDWNQSKTIGITISNMPEVDTFQIIRRGWEEGKIITVPKCIPKTRRLEFRKLTRFSQLESQYSGLYEPIVQETEFVDIENIDLLLVPGLAFSNKGYRLGFGGGYYDRVLPNFQGNTISLAFQDQLFSEIPIEVHDVPVKKIITETEVLSVEE